MKHIRLNEDARNGVAIDLSPLIDCVFLLLVFFVVATVFDPDTAVAIDRPVAASTDEVPRNAIRVTAERGGRLLCDGEVVTPRDLASAVARALSADGERPVLLVADGALPAHELIALVDACRQGGARRVAVAADPVSDPM